MKLPVAVLVAVVAAFVIALVVDTTRAAQGPIRLTATLSTSTLFRVPPAGRRADYVDQSWFLSDRTGARVGQMLLACRWILPRQRFCVGEIRMPLGTIQVQGASPTGFTGVYAVTGVTGIYSGGGTMKFTAIGARKSVLYVSITT